MPGTVYIWQLKEWPFFRWDKTRLAPLLSEARFKQGRLHGRMEGLGPERRRRAEIVVRTEEIYKSGRLGGSKLGLEDVGKTVNRWFGEEGFDDSVLGLFRILHDATRHYDEPLTIERICAWHRALVTHKSGSSPGSWRAGSDAARVSVGAAGYLAPPSDLIQQEMNRFQRWFERDNARDPLLKAALAHLGFVTIHPFGDGNGRIARVITEMQLARSEHSIHRYYSLTRRIFEERDRYYRKLERTQKGTLDVTEWMHWFLVQLIAAIDDAESLLGDILKRDLFWSRVSRAGLNERQINMLDRLLGAENTGGANVEADIAGGKGNGQETSAAGVTREAGVTITSSEWAAAAGVSQDTAGRDIRELVQRGVLAKNPGGGRSTSYRLAVQGSQVNR